tara:strand:- start:265 stop:528 length:264 start_codon:yes stop_codon:yes gene_type:complete
MKLTEDRKKEITNEAITRFELLLKNETFDQITSQGSPIVFNTQLGLYGGGPGYFKKFVTYLEYHSKEYDKIIMDLFNHYYSKYSKYA